MDYTKLYNNIISRATGRQKKHGLEHHHILPKSCGGTNDTTNLVLLTTREHYICHRLLVKIYADNHINRKKMIYALWWMSKTRNNHNGYIVNSHAYAHARHLFASDNPNKCEIRKQQFKKNHAAGNYNYDYLQVAETLKETLSKLSVSDMQARMNSSALSCDHKVRGDSIRKGKASQLQLTNTDGSTVVFWTYDDVYAITGYTYTQITYRIKRHDGMLLNNNKIEYLRRYDANDCRIGKPRRDRRNNNSV